MSNPPTGNGATARRPPPLLLKWCGPPPTAQYPYAVLEIALGRESCGYFVRAIPSDYGRAFEVTKLLKDGENPEYHVLLDGRRSSCDCPGHQRHGHCKHLDAIAFLAERGDLFGPTARRAEGEAA